MTENIVAINQLLGKESNPLKNQPKNAKIRKKY